MRLLPFEWCLKLKEWTFPVHSIFASRGEGFFASRVKGCLTLLGCWLVVSGTFVSFTVLEIQVDPVFEFLGNFTPGSSWPLLLLSINMFLLYYFWSRERMRWNLPGQKNGNFPSGQRNRLTDQNSRKKLANRKTKRFRVEHRRHSNLLFIK